MRSPRKLRRYRPLTDHLEALAPVSSLVSGLPATVNGPVGAGNRLEDSIPVSSSNPKPFAPPTVASVPLSNVRPKLPTRTTDQIASVPVSSLTSSITTASVQSGLIQPLAGTLVTLAAPSVPSVAAVPSATPPRQASPAVPLRSGGFVPNATPYASAPSRQTAAPVTGPTLVTAAPGGTAPVAGTVTSGRGAIRPVSMAPTTSHATAGATNTTFSPMDDPSGGGGSPPPQAPSVVISGGGIGYNQDGSLYGVVGGSVAVDVTPPTGEELQSVTYTISGAVQSQNYTWFSGSTTRLSGPVVHNLTYGSGDSLDFYWDETTGNHTITVQANYYDGAAPPVTSNVDVRQPNVQFFQDLYQPITAGSYTDSFSGIVSAGLTQGNGYATPGNQFTASVDTTGLPSNGTFAIIQLTQVNRQMTANNQIYTKNSNGYVLDCPFSAGYNSVTYGNYISDEIAPDQMLVPIPNVNYTPSAAYPNTTGSIVDSPYQGFQFVNGGQTTFSQISMNDNFQTYLVYQPDGGIWVALSMIQWNVSGSIINNAGVGNVGKWFPGNQPAPNPTGSNNILGNNQTSFVQWVNSVYPNIPDPTHPGLGTYWMSNGTPQRPPDF
jgi:hypothetical protein